MDVLKHLLRTAVALVAVGLFTPGGLAAQNTLEADIKATFLYNFTRFIEWPGQGTAGSAPFRVCVVADPTMEQAIRRTVDGEVVNGRPLVTALPQTPQEAEGCQILFVGGSEQQRAVPLLLAVRSLPVLTVGDAPEFLDDGGAIQFHLVDNRVRFDVSLPSTQRASLKVSANLLRVARQVRPNR